MSRPPRAADRELVRRAALRLGLQAAIGTGLVVALLAAVAVVVLVRSRSAADDILLSDTVARADDVEDPPSGTWLVIRTAAGTQATPGLPAELPLTGALDPGQRGRVGRAHRRHARRPGLSRAHCTTRHPRPPSRPC